jgi:inositol 3-alpha-galactosyltransferase
MSRKAAYTTLLTNNKYLPGVIVLWHGLRVSGSKYPLVVMTVPETPESALQALHRHGIQTRQVVEMRLHADTTGPNIAVHDARFHNVWTKLRYVHAPCSTFGTIVLKDAGLSL